jgi:hypothetical protein
MAAIGALTGIEEGTGSITVAYLILAHNAPEQLVRLVHALPQGSPVLIHFDRRADAALYRRCVELLADRPKVRFVTRHVCRWGAFGIVAGTIELMQQLLAHGESFDYATLLSGADYPIKSNAEIARFLARHRGAEFIESFSLMAPNRWSQHGGYFKTPEKMLCRHLRFRSRVLRIPGMRKLPRDMLPYGGSQWWTLSREAVEYIASFIARTPEFVAFCKYSYIPDESFVQTILSNSHLSDRVSGDDLRVSIWDRPQPPYPAILKIGDLPMLAASDKLFARKFDARIDSDILRALDERNSMQRHGSTAPSVQALAQGSPKAS